MDTVKANRYNNLLRLIEEAGSMVRLEERTGITANYLRQIKNKNVIQNGKPKGIGDKIAGKLEDGMGKPRGWLDQNHSMPSETKANPLIEIEEDDLLIIDVLNVEASAGFGSKGDIVEIVSQLKYVPEQFYAQYGKMNTDNIQVINVKGDSMLPTFRHGDLLFVDVTIEEFDGDGVYVFTCDDYTYVKRIQKQGSRYMVISDNSLYPAWELDQEIYIHGKVKIHQSQMLNFIG